ncbi:putative TRNA--methyltransferase non-catalytic subunit trm6MTase subunit trm6 [Heracleum sosnowskyi]|uniref:tRNA--methyltransferase non-catalytic subunit trm6MTase subunit trm6 n=1 Tax=Heracleum sosnowskyi TaxID=360622 RepID=A0AAD8HCF0_9APIA|nr:putative TRNA--methyltransferase non-catalytic subunit trm6MTase subunit trm6 [Heracleum sosnowskyi]
MESFAFDFDNMKTEKQNAMLRYRRLGNLTKLFRILELCLLLIFISWTSSRIPFLLKISKHYIRQLISIIISPLFIFVLSNVIVLTLLVKSGQFTTKSPSSTEKSDTNLYSEFTNNIEISANSDAENHSVVSEEEVVYQDKEIVGEINTVESKLCSDSIAEVKLQPENSILDEKVLHRSQSEDSKTEIWEKPGKELRQSEGEMCPKNETSGKSKAEIVEELSNEEFQRAIEAYIEKQLMFHKQEKFSIVPHV